MITDKKRQKKYTEISLKMSHTLSPSIIPQAGCIALRAPSFFFFSPLSKKHKEKKRGEGPLSIVLPW
jgi:hypothetical protein